MAIYPKAVVKILTNFTTPMPFPVRINNHTAVSNASSLYDYFSGAGFGLGSHFYLRKDGVVEQNVDTRYSAAADAQGNPDTISIETWDGYRADWFDGDPVPDYTIEQKLALLELWEWIFANHPTIPRTLAVDSKPGPSSHGISWHRLGVPATYEQLGQEISQTGGMLYSRAVGKVCPGDAKIASIKSLFEIINGEPITKDRLGVIVFNPFVGRFTSPYGARDGSFHAGIDIAPPVRGTVGEPVYAAFAGTVVKTVSTRVPGQTDRVNELAPYRTGNGPIIKNVGAGSSGDGEYQLYGHIRPTVSVGQVVKEGQIIGYTDLSGNMSGPHLHFEMWTSASTLTNPKTFDPEPIFIKNGVSIGVASPGTGASVDKADQIRLEGVGYYRGAIDGISGPMWVGAVKAFQTDNKLVVDGDFGNISRTFYDNKYKAQHTKVQEQLKKLIRKSTGKPYYGGIVDGVIGAVQRQATLDFQNDFGLVADAVWGQISQQKYDKVYIASIPLPPAPEPEPEPAPEPEPEPEPAPEPEPEPEPAPEPEPVPEPEPEPVPEPAPEPAPGPIFVPEIEEALRLLIQREVRAMLDGAMLSTTLGFKD